MLANDGLVALNDAPPEEAAQTYLDLGLAVLPLRHEGKTPATRHGVKDAVVATLSDAERKVRTKGWRRGMNATGFNIGLATGEGYAVDVLDVDVKDGKLGLRALKTLQEAGLLAGAVAYARTPSQGLHYYFPTAHGRSGKIDALGLDWQAAGKYVVASPSTLGMAPMQQPDGSCAVADRPYTWLWSRELTDGTPFDWEAAKRALGVVEPSPRYGSDDLRDFYDDRNPLDIAYELADWLLRQPSNRNGALLWAACRVWEAGAQPGDLEHLYRASLSMSHPGEDRDREIRNTILSARTRI